MKVPVGVSKRHVHLTKETFYKLFGSFDLPVRNYLNQPGQYASTLTVDLRWNENTIEHVRVCGPFREYNQVEIDEDDSKIFGVEPPLRKSGDIKESLPIQIIGPSNTVTINEGLIRAERHIHMIKEDAIKNNFYDDEKVYIKYGENIIFDARIKVENESFNELHIDTKDEILYDLHQGNEVEIIKCGK